MMKAIIVAGMLLAGCMASARGQTALDQDPADRAADAAFFAKPPASSVGARTPAPVAAPLPPILTKHTAWLDVRGVAASKKTTSYWETDWGSYQRGYDRQRRIAIQFGSVDSRPVQARLDVVFLGRGGGQPVISAHYSFATIKPGSGPHASGAAGSSHEEADNYEALGEFYDYGESVSGWIVRLSDSEGEVLAISASDGGLAQNAWNAEWWNALSGRAHWVQGR